MSAQWYVQTRGVTAAHDYDTWAAPGSGPGLPPGDVDKLVSAAWPGHGLGDLLDDERHSLLLFHHRTTGLVVIVTGLVSPGAPTDFQGRTIRAAMLGRATAEPDYAEVMAVAALGLREQIAQHLPVSWEETDKLGFRVSPYGWTALLSVAREALSQARLAPPDEPRGPRDSVISPDTAAERAVAAGHVAACQPAELGDRIIVLRTQRITAARIRALAPWQGLTDEPDTGKQIDKPAGPVTEVPQWVRELSEEVVREAVPVIWGTVKQLWRHRLALLIILIVLAGAAAGTFAAVSSGPASPMTVTSTTAPRDPPWVRPDT